VSKAYSVDESEFPLVTFHYHNLLTNDELEETIVAMDRILLSNRPHVFVVHTHHQRMMPLAQVRRQASHMMERTEMSRRYTRGVAMVIPSPVIRGVLKVTLSIAPMPCPYAVFDEPEGAIAWARAKMDLGAKRSSG